MTQTEKADRLSSDLAETIKTLSIDTSPPKIAMRTLEKADVDAKVAESWDDEERPDVGPADPVPKSFITRSGTSEMPAPPPPTPASPLSSRALPQYPRPTSASVSSGLHDSRPVSSSSKDADKRPEKSTAVANRLIAGALGVRAPKRTEEQRKYDRAIKEQEIRRKNKEKDDVKRKQEEAERAKASIWED